MANKHPLYHKLQEHGMLLVPEDLNVRIVVARDKNQVIGKHGTIYWNLPEDMKRFARDTKNSIIIAGRKTFETFKSPLKGRFNIIITSQADNMYDSDNLVFVKTYKDALLLALLLNQNTDYTKVNTKQVCVVGGEMVYNQALSADSIIPVHEILCTEVDLESELHTDDKYFHVPANYKLAQSEDFIDGTNNMDRTNHEISTYLTKCTWCKYQPKEDNKC